MEVRFLPPTQSGDPSAKEKKELKVYEDLAKIQKDLVFPQIKAEPFLALQKVPKAKPAKADDAGSKPPEKKPAAKKPKAPKASKDSDPLADNQS